jgi:hypothetical protein
MHDPSSWAKSPSLSPSPEQSQAADSAGDLAVAIVSWGIIGLMALGWTAFAGWVARYIHMDLVAVQQGLKPIGTGRGYAEFAWMLHQTIGLWPTTLLFFTAMMSPIPAIYVEIRRHGRQSQQREDN